MKIIKLSIFALLLLSWLLFVSSIIYTVYFIPVSTIPLLGPGAIDASYLNLSFFLIIIMVMLSNILFIKTNDKAFGILRRIVFYFTSLWPTVIILSMNTIDHVRYNTIAYINVFDLFHFWVQSLISWSTTLFISVCLIITLINIYYSRITKKSDSSS